VHQGRGHTTEVEEPLSDSLQRKTESEAAWETDAARKPRGLRRKLAYGLKIVPSYAWQRLTRHVPPGRIHLIVALADHFEPAIVPGDGQARASYPEQEQRLERWCREYPKIVDPWRDSDGRAFVHTYFYPAEQYDRGLVSRLADHCRAGWGEVEVHLHHGIPIPDTAENTRRTLVSFRDSLALDHGCLSYADGAGQPRYVFVHGNFALANSAHGFGCGVDDELQILADTGCYADMTLPTSPIHPSQCSKINSLYECVPPLRERAAYRRGRDLSRGHAAAKFPLIVQGPLMVDFSSQGRLRVDNGSFSASNPPTIHRLQLWKRAAVSVKGRPDWLFIKLHCHGMDPTQRDAVEGGSFRGFLRSMVEGAAARSEVLHFVSAREMVNLILAACAGREGDPSDYREYRFKRGKDAISQPTAGGASQAALRG
jgi:hypothetical protein